MNLENKYVVFYDGDCGFCNFWVGWILKRDFKNQFLFSALQSEFGQKFLKDRNLKNHDFETIYLFSERKFYLEKSNAFLKIAQILGRPYYLLKIFKIVPKYFRDKIYDFISRNRQKITAAKCYLPTQDERKKFIESF